MTKPNDDSEPKTYRDTWTPQPIFGVTLRDWFAGLAMHGELIRQDWDAQPPFGPKLAAKAYTFADAMLAERERKRDDT